VLIQVDITDHNAKEHNYLMITTINHLKKLFPENIFCHVLSNQQLVVFVPEYEYTEKERHERFIKVRNQLVKLLNRNILMVAGYPFDKDTQMHEAYWHLRHQLDIMDACQTFVICDRSNSQQELLPDFTSLQRLYYALIGGALDEALNYFENECTLLKNCTTRQNFHQRFTCLNTILQMAMEKHGLEMPQMFEYNDLEDFVQLTDNWTNMAKYLCEHINQQKKVTETI